MKCILSFNDSVSDFIREVVCIEFYRLEIAVYEIIMVMQY